MSKALANWLAVATVVNLVVLLSLIPALLVFDSPTGWGAFIILLIVGATYVPLWRFMQVKVDEAPGLTDLGRSNWHTWVGHGHHVGILMFWWFVLRSWANIESQPHEDTSSQ